MLQLVQGGVPPLLPLARATTPKLAPRRFVDMPGGHRIAYAEAGRGPDLVLIHGALMVLEDMWLGPMTALARHFRVVAFARPGHAASARARLVEASPWRQAKILGNAMRALGLTRPVVVGHS